VGGVGTVSGALIGGISTVLLLIVQDEVSFVIFGVSVLVALTRIGPGLAALGVSREPEGIVAQLQRETPWRRRASSSRGG
jgi:ABC-type branched-subunit amino acid transport system permease subunit